MTTTKAPPLTKTPRKTSAKLIPKLFKVKPLNEYPQSPISSEDHQAFTVAKMADEYRLAPVMQQLIAGNPKLYAYLETRLRWLQIYPDFRIMFVLLYICRDERDIALYCHALKKFAIDNPQATKIYFSHFQELFTNGFPSAHVRAQAWNDQLTKDGQIGVNDPQYW